MLDEYLYEQGLLLMSDQPFPQLREASIINKKSDEAAGKPGFSSRIR